MNFKKYTHRTEADVNASLNSKGVATNFTVVIAGKPFAGSTNHTLKTATVEVNTHFKVFGTPGMVINAASGEIVYTTA